MIEPASLFDDLPDAGRAPRAPSGPIRLGTSSFSSPDWVGPMYPPGTPPGEFLRLYAREFDTVEVDSTYYAVPSARTVDGWAAKTPDGFTLAAKFPRAIVHGGEGATPDPSKILVPTAVAQELDDFLLVMARLRERLGTLVLQFPYFNRTVFPAPEPFLERLDAFLARLPREGFAYAVEIRNRDWYGRAFRDVCARHGAGVVLVDQAWMPHGDEVIDALEPAAGGSLYVRLLGDRAAIERITKTWEREVLDQTPRMTRWARLLADQAAKGVRSFVYVNNHYAGHAPATLRRLRALIDAALAERA